MVRYPFLSSEWFDKVDELIASAGDLQIPAEMKNAELNVTIKGGAGDVQLNLKDGMFFRGHRDGLATSLTLAEALARRIFVDADVAAGVHAFLTGEIQVEGDLKPLVAMQTVDPSEPQKALTRRIAEITA
jgi:hypothetical protein